jgi:hypothetical protein
MSSAKSLKTSFRDLLEVSQQEDGPRFLSDDDLIFLHERKTPLEDVLLGELLFRLWLYRGARPTSFDKVLKKLLGEESLAAFDDLKAWDQRAEKIRSFDCVSGRVRSYLERQLQHCQNADGVILFARDDETAAAIPFNVARESGTLSDFCDLSRRAVPNCAAHLEELADDLGSAVRVTLRVSLGSMMSLFDGPSFCFPVVVALERCTGLLPLFHPFDLLTSADVVAGRLSAVSRLNAKRQLARKMGSDLLAPLVEPFDDALQVGQSLKSALLSVSKLLNSRGIGVRSQLQITELVAQTRKELHRGLITATEAERRLRFVDVNTESPGSAEWAREVSGRVALVRAAAANHRGDYRSGDLHLQKAKEHLLDLNGGADSFCEMLALEVVCLTDSGDLKAAEREGRALLKFAKTCSADVRQRKAIEMFASGVLGGQPLLVLGFEDEAKRRESRELLENAVELARWIEKPAEICRDVVQLSLWHALYEPERFDQAHDDALAELQRFPAHASPSNEYLRLYRMQAAYREAIFSSLNHDRDFHLWEIPCEESGEFGWLHACTLNFRAALYAHKGHKAHALADVSQAIERLAGVESPLLQFIRGTFFAMQSLIESGWPNASRPLNLSLVADYFGRVEHVFAQTWSTELRCQPTADTVLSLLRVSRY